jgi:hypothetical protein
VEEEELVDESEEEEAFLLRGDLLRLDQLELLDLLDLDKC